MSLLLDAHVLLWWLSDRAMLSPEARARIADPGDRVFVSITALWELAIPDDIEDVLAANGFAVLPIEVAHALAIATLPPLDRDPFDRMLVAQAIHEGLTLVTRDPWVAAYPVATLRA